MNHKTLSARKAPLLVLFLILSVACSDNKEQGPSLQINPGQLDFGLSTESLGLEVSNTGDGTLRWQAASEQPWVSPNPPEGSSGTGASSQLTVAVDRGGLQPGLHTGEITLTSNGGTQAVPVSLRAPGPVLVADPLVLDFGLEAVSEELSVSNSGTETLRWSAENDDEWIRIEPWEGDLPPDASTSIAVEISRAGLLQGNHESRFTLLSDGGDREITVRCQVPGPILSVVPKSLDFGKTLEEQPLTITNLGGGKLTWSAPMEEGWIWLEPEAGETLQSQDALVKIDRSLMGPGTHSAVLQVLSDGGTESVSVSVRVPSWTTLYLKPDLTLAPDLDPAGSLYQRRLSEDPVDWTKELGSAGATGTDYFLSLQGASYGPQELQVSLILEHATGEIPLVSTTFVIQSEAFQPYETLLSGPAEESLPPGGRLILRMESEGPVWIRMGDRDGEPSLIRVPFS